MPPTLKTRTGTPRLSDVAKHLVLPSDIVATGYPGVEAQCRKMGVEHDDWQRGLARALLAKRSTGLYAAGIGGAIISICRQAGKTFTIGSIVFALCILFPGTKVLWTAHHSATTDETFESLAAFARRRLVAPHIRQVRGGNGKQSIRFMNGSRISFGAREHGFGRGLQGVSIVVFDEAQILTERALTDMIPTTNVSKNPLVIYMGTPPKPTDPAEVFKGRRRKMLAVEAKRSAGEDAASDTLYIEVGADEGADPDDREQWAKANPSFPHRTPAESIQRMREQLGDDESFLREGMGVWDSDDPGSRAISRTLWDRQGVDAAPEGTISYGVAFSQDGTRVSLGGARKHSTGIHAELLDAQTGPVEDGIAPLADWLAGCWRQTAEIVISGAAGAETLKQALIERKVPPRMIRVLNTTQYLAACAGAYDSLLDRSLTHLADAGQQVLDDSVAVTDKKKRTASGAWGWEATTVDGDETPLEAISVAHYGARHTKRDPSRKQVIS
ncbi:MULTISPECIES: terminase large subunit domain-containing protein [unclassified Agrococcus]|uniref:terminase large subunit domain-containing protein n=1 Tax=unclassified Agrococcus TaxID=2615065 RepID=UPI003613825A